jgi:O-acetyl-ADP-ribose deacetylase (regulator of RNase III)
MIELGHGDLLQADAEALVNAINCVGVMGKGIALQFKQAFPENFRRYAQACAGEVRPGRMFVVDTGIPGRHRYIVNFPTKRHWRNGSRLEDIESGLRALVEEVQQRDIRSIAIPPLGCGNGGLRWADVKPRIEAAFAELAHVRVVLFEPSSA